jgi:amino acid transporter
MTTPSSAAAAATTTDADRQRLHELGYAQELNRKLGWFSNFAISFSIISILAGGITTYYLGGLAGGPRVILLGWIIVGFFALLVGMSMAEICSVYPTAGGLYYWSGKLAKKNGAMWSWFTGWFNLIGQIGVIASVDYALSLFIAYFISMYSDSYHLTPRGVFLIYALVLASHGILNTFRVNLVKILSEISVWWHLIGVAVIFLFLLVLPSNREGFGFLWNWNNATGWTNNGNGSHIPGLYVALIGLLLAQYTITGFDASAHVSEETTDANRSASIAIVRSIYISAIAALFLNIAMVQATPKGTFNTLILGRDGFYATGGANALAAPLGGAGAKFLILISIVAQYFCGMASVTANSRMIYAFSRDGAIPGHRLWHRVNPRTRTPTNSVWLGVTLSLIVGGISLYQAHKYSVAFFALTGMCVVGLYIAYVIPIYLRLTNPDFKKGAWHLRGWSKIVGWTAVAWVAFITVIFFAPPFWPFWPLNGKTVTGSGASAVTIYHSSNFNFTGPIIVSLFILVGLWWVISARKWFTGPQVQGTPEELREIERALEAVDVDVRRAEELEDLEDERVIERQHEH